MYKVVLFLLFNLLLCAQVTGQDTDSITRKIGSYIQAVNNFSNYIPQEKVYLHFDNTSYYQGDNIWFKCYIVTSGLNRATQLSKALYVELLNPGGDIIDKRILKIENGQCHGDFMLSFLPFYSGFYEVRAYTKYMLNFGEDAVFSRLLPVFEKPEIEGDFEKKDMRKYGTGGYPVKRKKPRKEKKLNVRFFPEGGNLVQGLSSKVAFEATDEFGKPVEVTGNIVNEAKESIAHFSVEHEGRGSFEYTPVIDKRKAVVSYKGKNYQFDLPNALNEGIVLKVDNVSRTDSIKVVLQKSKTVTTDMLGMVLLSNGSMEDACLIDMEGDGEVSFLIGKAGLPGGVSQIIIFDSMGNIVCERMMFIHPRNTFRFNVQTEKTVYKPFEKVDMEFSLTGKNEKPVETSFSVSVRDGMNEVDYRRNIMTDLLLMSDIKGHVANPSYYFETDDITHRKVLDDLLMVQGWRRYVWDYLAGKTTFDIKHLPEQGIEVRGEVVSMVRKKPKPGVDVSCFLLKRGEEGAGNLIESFVTDSLGRFSFALDVEGRWNMILSVMEKGKKKDHRIILDRVFTPDPRGYRYNEMEVNIAGTVEVKAEEEPATQLIEEDLDTFFKAFEDSLARAGIEEKVHRLDEVTVKGKKRSKEKEIYENRAKSVVYYDVHSELDDIKDSGEYIGDDIHALLMSINDKFIPTPDREYLRYKSRLPLFCINYERTRHTELDYNKYKLLRLDAIKSIYINENLSIMTRYADPRMSSMDVDEIYGCIVFIETYPEGEIPTQPGKGVRKTKLEGYSPVKVFDGPDYSILPHDPDYRRTLYWNPSVTTDKDGKARIEFYNSSSCRKFTISAEAVTQSGMIGVYKDE